MNFLQKIAERAGRLLESNNDEVLVFLAIFLFFLLGKAKDREDTDEYERVDSGTLVFLIVFAVVLLLGNSRDEVL